MAETFTMDIPIPPSVNKTRRIDWSGHRLMKEWRRQAGLHMMEQGQFRGRPQGIGRYELTVVLDEAQCAIDPDNTVKACADFLKNINVITDDSPKYARRIVIEWGDAPRGARLILRSLNQ
jgi:Holliday junction resolvase RusA-like endonuclease